MADTKTSIPEKKYNLLNCFADLIETKFPALSAVVERMFSLSGYIHSLGPERLSYFFRLSNSEIK